MISRRRRSNPAPPPRERFRRRVRVRVRVRIRVRVRVRVRPPRRRQLPPRRRQLPSDPRRRPSPRHPILLPVDARNILFSAAVSIWVAGTRLEGSGVSLANPSANLRQRRPPRDRRETKDAINLARTSFVFSRTSPRRRFARYRARWRRAHPRRRTIRRTRTSSTRFAPRRRVSPRVHLFPSRRGFARTRPDFEPRRSSV